ncbi:hypothetical protein QE152_g10037 [Popillia japonica]|uniref:Uncharacterized protein n=1 Tax=Popillia japonica TaxID=7064 RepID=A0AAW1LW98_POPJA
MSNIPCTITLKSLDWEQLPPNMLYVVCREIFRFGVKKIHLNNSQVYLYLTYTPKGLTYTPKGETMKKKLGNLPIQYVRLTSETAEDVEFNLFGLAVKRFKFNIKTDEEELEMLAGEEAVTKKSLPGIEMLPPQSSSSSTSKKRLSLKKAPDEGKKIKILENILIEDNDDDDACDSNLFCSQKYNF